MRMRSIHLLLVALSFAIFTTGNGQSPPPLRSITIYIQNPTSSVVGFSYRKGGDDWSNLTIKPGSTWTLPGIAPHQMSRVVTPSGATPFRKNRE